MYLTIVCSQSDRF